MPPAHRAGLAECPDLPTTTSAATFPPETERHPMIEPTTETELAEAVAGTSGPLRIIGGATRSVGNDTAGDILSTARLSGIRIYDPGSLTLVAGAGTPMSEIEEALVANKQRLAFEPMDHRGLLGTGGTPTIGGVVAANVSGPRRVQAGACRDYLLGVRFVDGLGRITKNGGRVMKNVTGYDLAKLMAGSHGTLGVISEVAFKVLPVPDKEALLSIRALSDRDAQNALSLALGSPFQITGAAHFSKSGDGNAVTMIRIEGFADSVDYRANRLVELLAPVGDVKVETDGDKTAATWKKVRDAEPFHGGTGDIWRISVKPTDGPLVGERLNADGLIYDWGGGLIWARMPEGADVRDLMQGIPGHATLVRGGVETRANIPAFPPETGPLAAISAGLRAKFDPKEILNPGLMG